jgi:hypothetical protein
MSSMTKTYRTAADKFRRLIASPSPEQLFAEAFKVFQFDYFRKVSDRSTHLTQALNRLAASPEYQKAVNPLAQRHKLYEQYLQNMGDDFINDVSQIVVPHCDEIPEPQIQTLQKELGDIFAVRLAQAKMAESTLLAIDASADNSSSALTSLESLFNYSTFRFSELIVSTIRQANLHADRRKLDRRKQRLTEIVKELLRKALAGGGIIFYGGLILKALGIIN